MAVRQGRCVRFELEAAPGQVLFPGQDLPDGVELPVGRLEQRRHFSLRGVHANGRYVRTLAEVLARREWEGQAAWRPPFALPEELPMDPDDVAELLGTSRKRRLKDCSLGDCTRQEPL